MSEFLVLGEVLLFAFIGYLGRKWDLGLLRGEPPPGGKAAVTLRLMRPGGWIVTTTLVVFVACPRLHPGLLFVLPAVFFQQAFLFAVNDYWDRNVDALNAFKRRRNVLSSGELTPAQGRFLLACLLLLGLLFAIPRGWPATLLAAVFLFLSYAYSSPPFRLKARSFWDLVSHGLLVFSYPFLFTCVALSLYSLKTLILYAIFVLFSLYIQLSQEARDFEEDAQVETNSVLRMGYRKAFQLMGLLLGCSCLLSLALVLSPPVSPLYFLLGSLCAFHLYDLGTTWKSGKYGLCFQNAWRGFTRKTLVGLVPVLLWWLVQRLSR